MEELPGLRPLVRLELPFLARCHHTDDTVPSLRAELPKRVNTIDREILDLRLNLIPPAPMCVLLR